MGGFRFLFLFVAVLVCTACTPGGQDAGEPETFVTVENTEPATPLEVFYQTDAVECNDADQTVVEIRNAEPGEPIEFTSVQPVRIDDGVADGDGRYRLRWRCSPEESRLRWDITATGRTSGNTVEFTIAGSHEAAAVDTLTITSIEDPFLCDGIKRPVGLLTDAAPGEKVEIRSPERSLSRRRQADDQGQIILEWQCSPDEQAFQWNITAVGEQSGLTGTFWITGVSPTPEQIPDLTFAVLEDPFACDRQARVFATVSDLAPNEPVRIEAADAADVRDGRADGNGTLELRWQCGLGDVGRTWSITATGVDTLRTGTISVTGSAPPEGTFKPLVATFTEQPFRCDGASRYFAVLENLLPLEVVNFSSPNAESIKPGQADEDGKLAIRWQCDAEDVGRSWDVTATTTTSEKSVTFTITGAAP